MMTFREITDDDAQILIDWRRKPRVTQWMLTDIEPDIQKQLGWIQHMREDKTSYHWIFQLNGADIGYAKINDLTLEKGFAEHGSYIGEDNYTYLHMGMLKSFLESILTAFNLQYLISAIIDGNNVEKIMNYLGYEPDPSRPFKTLSDGRILKPYYISREKFFKKFPIKKSAPLPTALWKCRP